MRKLLSKKLLVAVAMTGLLFSNANAEKVQIDTASIEKLLNQYWDICYQAYNKQGNPDDRRKAMAQLIEGHSTVLAGDYINTCAGDIERANDENKKVYKGKLDMSRKLKILGMGKRQNCNGNGNCLSVSYYIFTSQDPSWKPNSSRPSGVSFDSKVRVTKNPDGSLKFLII